ncbi:MAG: response regulator [Candidatus Woesearchaeota archaeon]
MVKVITIDDSTLMTTVVKNFVLKQIPDAQVFEAHSGEDGLELYKKELPDMVFLDIKMPGIDGFEVLAQIKKINPTAKVVMVTSLKEPEHEQKGKELGVIDYITKPFNSEQISEAIKKCM